MLYSKYGALIWRPLTIIKNKVHTALGRFIELVVIEPSVFRMFLPCLFAMTIFLIAGWKERGWLARGPSWTAWFLGSLHFVLPLWAGPQGVNSALVWWNKRRRRDTQIYKSCCRHRDEVEKLENETCHCSWRQRGLRMALCLSKTVFFLVAFHVVADLMKSIEKSFLWNSLYGIQRGYVICFKCIH